MGDSRFTAIFSFAITAALFYYLHRHTQIKKALQTLTARWPKSDSTDLHPNALISLALQLLAHHGLLQYFDVGAFYKLLTTLTDPHSKHSGYRDHPYHNIHHAMHVLTNVHKLFQSLRADLEINTSDMEKLALFLGALFHDLEHDGCSNKLHREVDGNTSTSPLESKSVALSILLFPSFLRLKPLDQALFSPLFSSLILCTDIGNKLQTDHLKTQKETETYLHYCMRLGDIGCVFQDHATYEVWSRALFDENTKAGEGVTAEAMRESQRSFLTNYVRQELNHNLKLFDGAAAAEYASCLEKNIAML